MGDDSLSQPFVLHRTDGTRREFKKVAPEDRISFRAIFKEYRRYGIVAFLNIEGVPLKDRVPHYAAFERQRVYESDALGWLLEPEGQNEAILLSLRRENANAEMKDVHALKL